MKEVELWSAVYRTTRDIHAVPDTNMLVEAWHRLLKHHFMGSKHGRRVDQLIHVLATVAIPHYQQRHLRQSLGFDGMDLTQTEIDLATRKGADIPPEDVLPRKDLVQAYTVRSQTMRDRTYVVHVDTACNCTCLAFPRILYCKHIRAVQIHFQLDLPAPIHSRSALDYDGHADDPESECDITITENNDLGDASDHSSVVLSHDHHPAALRADPALVGRLQADVAWIACRLLAGPTLPETAALVALADALTLAVQSVKLLDAGATVPPPDALPPRKQVGPRQQQQTLTAAAMGAGIKGAEKRKRKRGDGDRGELPEFEAGEEPGLKAKPDARGLAITSSGNFDAKNFDIGDEKAVDALNAIQMQELCKQHGVTTARGPQKTEKMAQRLLAHSRECQCGRAGAAPADKALPPALPPVPVSLPPVPPPCPGPPPTYYGLPSSYSTPSVASAVVTPYFQYIPYYTPQYHVPTYSYTAP